MSLWAPASETMELWLDAADATTRTMVGSKLSVWADKSGNGRSFFQNNDTYRPTIAAARVNGLDAIDMNASHRWLDCTLFPIVSGQDVYAVVDAPNLGTSWRMFLSRNNAVLNELALYIGTDLSNYRPSVYWHGSGRGINGSSVRRLALTQWFFTTGTNGEAGTRVDAALAASRTTGNFTSITNWAALNSSLSSQWSAMFPCEVIMFPSARNEFQRAAIEGYLAHKWGLAGNLPTDHPYKLNSPCVLSGNAVKATGGPADTVLIRHWATRKHMWTAIPNGVGDWSAPAPATEEIDITYLAAGCAPICHGPYTVPAS